MKKRIIILIILVLIIVSVLYSCTGHTMIAKTSEYTSEMYTDSEIEAAIDVAKQYFRLHFYGCTLTEITYAGDEESKGYRDWALRNDADEVIVLISSFDVGPSGGDGSLNRNSTYTDWKWILVRKTGGKWQHADHGYG